MRAIVKNIIPGDEENDSRVHPIVPGGLVHFVPEMSQYCGKEISVEQSTINRWFYQRCNNSAGMWWYHKDWLDFIEET